MAEYISFQPSDFYNTKLYEGNSSTQAITGVGFQPDFVWIKNRTDTNNHRLYDAARGVENSIISDDNSAQSTSTGLTAFDSDGFTLGSTGSQNGTGHDYASWNWKAGTTSGLSGGTITPTAYSINTTSGFGVYAYKGTGSNATIAHGLGVAPTFMMVKRLNSTDSWRVYHSGIGPTKYMTLNSTAAETTEATIWNSTAPDATVFSIGTDSSVNTSTNTYIAYVFAPIKGFSAFNMFQGQADDNGPFCFTGFRPAIVIMKKSGSGSAANWQLANTKMSSAGGANVINRQMLPDTSAIAQTEDSMDLLSNGFKIRNGDAHFNQNLQPFIYAAFAEFPLVSSNDVPGLAR